MRIIGLTGGIASGKSTVAKLLRDLGAPVVDADLLAREVVAVGSDGLGEIAREFGESVLLPSGELDRKALGALVFADERARKTLESITHPRIAKSGQDAMAALAAKGESVAFYEAALIVEKDLYKGMHGLVVVAVPEALQLERLQSRDGIDYEEARARLDSQLPLAAKLEVADFVIDNSGTLEETKDQVKELWERIRGEAQVTSK